MGYTILVVEDTPDSRDLMRLLLDAEVSITQVRLFLIWLEDFQHFGYVKVLSLAGLRLKEPVYS